MSEMSRPPVSPGEPGGRCHLQPEPPEALPSPTCWGRKEDGFVVIWGREESS